MNVYLSIFGNILKEKAAWLWLALYPRIKPPKFSTGWLESFKARHSIRSYKKYGEVTDVDIEDSAKATHNIRVRTSEYTLSNIYNIDQTGLY